MKQCKRNGWHTGIGMLILFGMLGVLMPAGSQVLAVTDYVKFSVNGDTTATSMVQGDTLSWGANCETGATILWEIWYDVDMSGDIDEGVDVSIFSFPIADGDTASDGPPPDINPVPDGIFWSAPMELGIAPGQYVFRATDLTDDTQASMAIVVTPLMAPANTFEGRIVVDGYPAPDAMLQWVWIEANLEDGDQMWSAFTDENGEFTINVGDAGTGLTFRIEPREISGFVTPARQEVVASGAVVLDDLVYEVPAASIYGTVIDENGDPLPMPVYVYASPNFEGASEKNTETVDGEYAMSFGPSELGEWWVGVSSNNLVPDYLVPSNVLLDNSVTSDIQQDFECPTADAVLYVLVTEGGAEPVHEYMILGYCESAGLGTNVVSGMGSSNLAELHISSLYDGEWSVSVSTWDSAYMVPEGYFLENTITNSLSSGDTVHLNFVAGKMVRDTLTVDAGDPIPDWQMVAVSMWDGMGSNYMTHPDDNGVYTIYADTGAYSLNAQTMNYYSLPVVRTLHLTDDTTGGMGFVFNQTHCRISGSLQGVPLPLSGYIYLMATSEGIGLGATIDTMTGTFELHVFDGDWVFTPPYIDGYNLPDTVHLIIDESPDTVRTFNFDYSPILGIEDESSGGLPTSFALGQNHPNPFNPSTAIEYSLPVRSQVTVEVFNLLGQQVRTLVDEVKGPGTYRVEWNGMDAAGQSVASGIYLYRFAADSYTQTRKMLLVK